MLPANTGTQSEWFSELVSEWLTEWVSKWVTDWMTEWLVTCQWLHEWIKLWMNGCAVDLVDKSIKRITSKFMLVMWHTTTILLTEQRMNTVHSGSFHSLCMRRICKWNAYLFYFAKCLVHNMFGWHVDNWTSVCNIWINLDQIQLVYHDWAQ